jgi:hypothetical protein
MTLDRLPPDPPERRPPPTLIWLCLGLMLVALFAAAVLLLGRPSPLGVSDNADPAVVESQSPVAPGIAK